VEQQLCAAGQHQFVRRHLEGRVVVGLRCDLAAEQPMRLVQAVQGAHALQQLVGQTVHHLADFAMHIGMQAAEVGHASRCAHAAEKAVALD
jgi:hypothetical protein